MPPERGTMSKYHTPVMLQECIDGLAIKKEGTYVDVTFGGGGHSREIMKHLGPDGRLLAFDQDADAQQNMIDDEREAQIRANLQVGIPNLPGPAQSIGFLLCRLVELRAEYNESRAKVSELAVKLGEARAEVERLLKFNEQLGKVNFGLRQELTNLRAPPNADVMESTINSGSRTCSPALSSSTATSERRS